MLNSPLSDEDVPGTDVEEMEPDDSGEVEQLDEEQVDAGDDQEEQAEEEIVVTLDQPQEEPEEGQHKGKSLPNELRRLLRQEQKEKKRIADELERLKGGGQQSNTLPEKPTLENPGTGNSDDSYDAEVFQRELDKWYAKKSVYDREQDRQRAIQEEANKEWQSVQETYTKGKARFAQDKMQEAEDEVVSILSPARQAMLLDVADDSALLAYALGTNPETLRKVASIKSDAKFIKELAKIEMNIKPQQKKAAPPPERTISGSGRTPGASASNLNALYEKAQKTGDYTAYYAAKHKAK
jgi:hypothetical protein